jgi:hypothetical protein
MGERRGGAGGASGDDLALAVHARVNTPLRGSIAA